MTPKQIDFLNIGLVLTAAILAYFFPLEVFILAFSILGPLHYLTEINWLDSKSYFTKNKKNVWLVIGIFASLIIVLPKLYFSYFEEGDLMIDKLFSFINKWSNSAIFVSLSLAIGFLYIRKFYGWVILTTTAITGAILLNEIEAYSMIIGMLIPTVVHVYFFTLLFMLYGALKSKSKYTYFPIILALVVPVLFIFIEVNPNNYAFGDAMKSNYIDNGLHVAPVLFAKFIGVSDGKSFFFYEQMELRLMMFMSFIYLYHYLNWFSKTTIISWHKKLTIKKSLIIGILWATMMTLFFVNFRIGFLVALFFSFLHVILEFPLNMVSIARLFSSKKKE